MKTAKITSCTFKKPYEGKHGTIYYHAIEFDNGDKGEIGAKSENPDKLQPGKELTYELTPNGDYPNKIKAVQENGFKGGKSQGNIAGYALSYSKDLVIADKVKIDQILATADKFYNWLKERS